jgi:hypothetical protein
MNTENFNEITKRIEKTNLEKEKTDKLSNLVGLNDLLGSRGDNLAIIKTGYNF